MVLCYSDREPEAVRIAIANLETDVKKVLPGVKVYRQTGKELPILAAGGSVIAIHTLTDEDRETHTGWELMQDKSGFLHKEAYQLKVEEGRLSITGTDRRGTIYGIYTICEWMGVSPWYFFADVPVKEKTEIWLEDGYCQRNWPSVEYRGIFINDEEELEAWVQNHMGESTIGVKSYEKIFELLLRLKANYIWPAMHVNSFNLTPENGALAERMGIVVGTSHCDMLMRSNNREWIPWITKKGYHDAVYDYSIEGRNREILKEYWKESVEQNRDFEVCYTLGMRGIHDSGFETKNLKGKTEEEARNAKIELLEKIIGDQREILKHTLGHEAMMTFIPYKEVLDLYDHGLRIPEDMTLVWANDNYGYIRRFPSEKEKERKGGNGIYYHNSYWAPPSMSYVFLNSIPLAHTRNELQKAWDEGIRKLWVLNSGAVKPLEQEITFFLRLAWEIGKPGALTENVEDFVTDWIDHMFTGKIGEQVSVLLNDFSQLTNVRKVENMDYDAFSQTAYGDEASLRIHRYEQLFAKGNYLYRKLPDEEKAAFFQLVLMRIHAAYFTNLSYYYGDRSTLMYDRGNMQAAALYTEKSREAEDARRRMLHYFNHAMCGGKWNGILDPEGFPPPRAAMMPVCTPPLKIEGPPSMRVDVWNEEKELRFVSPGEKWVEIGNTGTGELAVRLEAPEWVRLSEKQVLIRGEKRILVSVPEINENRQGEIRVCGCPVSPDGLAKPGADSVHIIPVSAAKPVFMMERAGIREGMRENVSEIPLCALEEDGLVALEAGQCLAGDASGDFKRIPRLGRLQGDLAEACVRREPGEKAEPMRCRFAVESRGEFLLEIHRFPSLNSVGRIRIGISLDDGPVQVAESFSNDEWRGDWKINVLNNVDRLYVKLPMAEPGVHSLCVWAIDRYFAFSRMVIYTKMRKENNLAGIRGSQPLPRDWDVSGWCDEFYGECSLLPRPVFYESGNCPDAAGAKFRRQAALVYALMEGKGDDLGSSCLMVQARDHGKKVKPDWYLEQGSSLFTEQDGTVKIDAAMALAQSDFAWSSGIWRHCGSESHGRSGLAMYIRTPGLSWEAKEAPCLNYRIFCQGGQYTLWMLSKFNVQEEGVFAVGFDGDILPEEALYQKGRLWRYEAEQIYRWVPVAVIELQPGEHVFSVYALASGMRYDRFYLTKGKERPPVDGE